MLLVAVARAGLLLERVFRTLLDCNPTRLRNHESTEAWDEAADVAPGISAAWPDDDDLATPGIILGINPPDVDDLAPGRGIILALNVPDVHVRSDVDDLRRFGPRWAPPRNGMPSSES